MEKNEEMYDLARKDLPRAEDTSDLDGVEEMQKRKAKKRVLSLPGEETDDDAPPAPLKQVKKETSLSPKVTKNNYQFSHSLSLNAGPFSQPSNQEKEISGSNRNYSSPLSATPCSSKGQLFQHSDSSVVELLLKQSAMMEDMSKKLLDISHQVNNLESKLDAIHARMENSNNDEQEIDFSSVLPLRNLEGLVKLEKLLQDEPSLRKRLAGCFCSASNSTKLLISHCGDQGKSTKEVLSSRRTSPTKHSQAGVNNEGGVWLVKHLRLCGSKDLQKTINNIMSRLLADELAICYSLSGKSTKGLVKHAFVTTRLWPIVLQTCQQVTCSVTSDKVREAVGNWLHQAKTRMTRRTSALEEIFDYDSI